MYLTKKNRLIIQEKFRIRIEISKNTLPIILESSISTANIAEPKFKYSSLDELHQLNCDHAEMGYIDCPKRENVLRNPSWTLISSIMGSF